MSYTIVRTINCDRCGQWIDGPDPTCTAREMRAYARKRRWRTALPGGRDLCPDCPTEEKPEAPE